MTRTSFDRPGNIFENVELWRKFMEQTHTTNQTRNKSSTAEVTLPKASKHLTSLLELYGHLTERNVKHLYMHYTQDAFFKNPITEVYTTEEIQKYFLKMVDKISDVHYVFDNIIEKGNQAFTTWVMTARFMGREFSVQGASHFKFDDNDLCEYQRDYVDLSEEIYEQVPLLGLMFRGIKRVLN